MSNPSRHHLGALALVVGLLVACSEEPPTSPDGSATQTSDASPTGEPAAEDDPATEGAPPTEAAPTGPPAVTRQDMLQILWEERGLEGEPEPVDLIREVSDAEYMPMQAECLTAAGFPPDSVGDAYSWEVPAAQADAFTMADYRCAAQYPRFLAYLQPYTDEQMTLIYDWVAEHTIPCYAEQGHHVTGMPSLEAFLDQYRTTQTWWLPQDGMDEITFEERQTLERACPRLPSQEVLYGG